MATTTAATRQVEGSAESTGEAGDERRIRLTVELSQSLYDMLTTLAVETHSSRADVLRRALALMQVAVEGRKKGQKLGLADKDQELAEEIIGLGL